MNAKPGKSTKRQNTGRVSPALGDLVSCHFLDHVEGDSEPLACVVFGKIVSKSRLSFEILCWGYADGQRRGDSNETRFCIVRSTITKLSILNS